VQRVAELEAAPRAKHAAGVEPAVVPETVATVQSVAAPSCVHTLATQACTSMDPLQHLGPASGEKLALGVETAVAHRLAASVRLAAGVVPGTSERPAVNVHRVAALDVASCEKQAAGVEPAAVLETVATVQLAAALSCGHTLATQACIAHPGNTGLRSHELHAH
jgi:hypothetical protein